MSSEGRTMSSSSGAVGAVMSTTGGGAGATLSPPAAMRTELGIVAALLAAAGLAWWSTVDRMAGMDAGPGTALGSVGWFTGVWATMMVAMMLPSLAPAAAAFAASVRRELSRVLLVAGGYLIVWSVGGRVCGDCPPRCSMDAPVRRRLSTRLERRGHRGLRPVRARQEPVRRLAGLAQRRPLARGGDSCPPPALPDLP